MTKKNVLWIYQLRLEFQIPITEFGFELSKQQFWNAIRLRYGWEISNLPTSCPCSSKFDIQHSISCKKGAFVSIRHNELRDLTANMRSVQGYQN